MNPIRNMGFVEISNGVKKAISIKDLVAGALKGLVGKERPNQEEIGAAWESAVGKSGAAHARPVALNRSVLMVNVDGSAWLYELSTRKKEILNKLAQELGGKKPKDIRFRIGAVKQP